MSSSLTDRYVTAVLSSVPHERRVTVEPELRASIAEAVANRIAAGADEESAERAVLSELGDPIRVGALQTGRVLALIGPAVYPTYVRLLKLLLVIVVPIITVLAGIGSVVAGNGVVTVIGAAISAGIQIGIQLTFWVTVVFAIIDRRGVATPSSWDLDDLPEIASRRIGIGETVGAIVGLALLTWFLLWQPGFQATLGVGEPIPILDPALSSFWIPFLVVVLLASIVLEIVKFRTGHWSVPLAAANTVLNAAFAIPAVWLLTSNQVLNPDFIDALATDVSSGLAFVPTLIAWLIAIFGAIDVIEGWWKSLR